ncbi:MAG: methyl-accepting chemotaxis protein [Hydrogenophaga sp.]|nr:methyl-accepting chemotaxis protein [Hydrogenophaga sp.]
MKISTRLYGLVALLSAVLVGIGVLGLYANQLTNNALQTVYEDRTVPLAELGDVNYLVNRNRILLMDMLITGMVASDRAAIQKRLEEYKTNTARMDEIWKAVTATRFTPEETRLADGFQLELKAFVKEGIEPAMAAVLDDNVDVAGRLYRDQVSPIAHKVQSSFNQLVALQTRMAREEYEHAVERYGQVRLIALASIVLGVGLAVALGVSLVRGISRSLKLAGHLTQAVASGDLSTQVTVSGRDEVSEVLRLLQAMQAQLAQTVSRVRQGADAVSAASVALAQGNQDLSSRTENQASALEQTAASMEQLGATVRQNADNAQQANQLARQASEVARAGGQVVTDVVGTMGGISESSKKIADIINVIDGIAFQTNILALNAAVEAARAGEQGRGFAVVAGEVRNLAQRSAQAAKEIKDLITQSVERVEQGSAQADQAGSTMQEVVAGIRRVTDLVGEITAASKEQSDGVVQVGQAVTQMDQVTQQNAAQVQQMATAAGSLQSQAQALVQAVAFFKLGAEAAVVSGRPQEPPVLATARTRSAAPAPVPRQALPERRPVAQARLATPRAAPVKQADASGDWESF